MVTEGAVADAIERSVDLPAFPVVTLQYSMTEATRLGHVLAPACIGPMLALAREVNQRWRKRPLVELDVPVLSGVHGPDELQRVLDQRLHGSMTPEADGTEIHRRLMIVPMRRSQLAA